jgi:hypothetical protein
MFLIFYGPLLMLSSYYGTQHPTVVATFIVLDWGDKVNPMPESTISPDRDYESGY